MTQTETDSSTSTSTSTAQITIEKKGSLTEATLNGRVISSSTNSTHVINYALAHSGVSHVKILNGSYLVQVSQVLEGIRPDGTILYRRIGIAFSRSNVSLSGQSGDGVILKASNPDMNVISIKDYQNSPVLQNIIVSSLTIDCAKPVNSFTRVEPVCGIAFRKVSNGTISNIHVKNSQYIGIAVTGVFRFPEDGAGGNITIENSLVENCNDNGYDIAGDGMKILNCQATNCALGGGTANIDFDGADAPLVQTFFSKGGWKGMHVGNPVRQTNNSILDNIDIYSPQNQGLELDGTIGTIINTAHLEGENGPALWAHHNAQATVSGINLNRPAIIEAGSQIRGL